MNPGVISNNIIKVSKEGAIPTPDLLVTEEPMEIQLLHPSLSEPLPLILTMRTPGNDFELTTGFLLAENIINGMEDIEHMFHCKLVETAAKGNVVKVKLKPHVKIDTDMYARNFTSTAGCGICGKQQLDQIICNASSMQGNNLKAKFDIISSLPASLMFHQNIFKHTGGLHASALFSAEGELVLSREDIGRHNALDKVIGACLALDPDLLGNSILLVSGRIGFELVQKAAVAGIPIMVGVGAPSSLSVQLAAKMDMTLIGFAKESSFNIYHGEKRIIINGTNKIE
ncbi:formate dehydrogenase accessory sulfurtransferase FdhD [Flavobacteriaceae bacterium F89]|uniref:Sulfur carrier protein FdhD n=1 Tax=Cerina litoralis TaxID=2874477 RepID=A0AAE3ESP6_9FLAO|nr:formate dehydrogenase accessory sulfurtransferase FdhD [Cerina litoralis]MCG2459429.1 formate dehydrogenase accessory sulfurtransferase FdhD [Cerina litoralis]